MSQPSSMPGWTWVVTAPVLLLPWVLVKFMFWIVLWVLLLTWRTVLALWALRFVPLIFILVWAVGVPLQESQKTFLDIGHTVTECTDFLWNSGLRFILEDLIWCLRGLCDILNLVAETFVITFRLVFDALVGLIDDIFKKRQAERMVRQAAAATNKRFVFDGFPAANSTAPHFGIIEDICIVINDIIDILKDVLIVVIGTVGNFVFQIIDEDIITSDVFNLIGELINFLLVDVLGIPCLDFANGFTGFVEGLEDCLSGPLGDLEDIGDCASSEADFTDFQNCVNAKKRRRFSSRSTTATLLEENLGPNHGRQNLTLAERWERLSDWVGGTLLESKVLPFSGNEKTRGMSAVGGRSPPIYRTPDPRKTTYGQRLWISFATVIRNKIIVFSTTHFDKETFRVVSMPYREKLRALRLMKTDLAVRDFFISFGDYTRERSIALGGAGAPITANLHTMTTAIVTRLLAPHRLNATLEHFKTRSPEYASAVKRVALRISMLDNAKLSRTQEILAGRLRAETVYKYIPRNYSPSGSFSLLTSQQEGRKNVLRGTIWDITNVLDQAGYADPESQLRHEMDDLMAQWKRNNNVTSWRQQRTRDKKKDVARGRYSYAVFPHDDPGLVTDQHRDVARNLVRNVNSVAGLAMPQARVPVAAIAKVFLKNPKFILAGIVPFLSSKPGQVVISRYLKLMNPIFGKYFSKGLTDLDENDILDFALEFTEVTIENFFYLVNVILQFLGCALWAMILKVGSMILGFIPYVGFIFKLIGNWAVTGGALMIGNCPPDPLLDDNNVPLQNPMQYVNDILRCWETSVDCTSSADCAGNAPCRVVNTAFQWHTFFFTLGPQTSTFKNDDDVGFCLCWPRFPCGSDTPFMGSFENFPTFDSKFDISDFANETYGSDTPTLPTFAFSNLFDVDCAKEYGYEIKRIVWYKESNLFKMAWYNIRNSWLGSRYVFRDWIFSFPKQSATLFTLLLIIPLMLFLIGNLRAAVIITFVIMAIVFGMPQFSKLTEDQIVPYLERTKKAVFFLNPLWTLMLDWMRFPNHSPTNVLGSAGSGEGTCAIINSPAIFGGLGLAITGGIILWYFFFISIFLGIVFFIFAFLSAPFRILWNIGACYVFYTDAYDVSLSRRQGYYVEGHLSNYQPLGGGLLPAKQQQQQQQQKYIIAAPYRVSRRRHRRRRHFTKNNKPQTNSQQQQQQQVPSFMNRVRKEINPPTFADVWQSVVEPLFREPRYQSHVVLPNAALIPQDMEGGGDFPEEKEM